MRTLMVAAVAGLLAVSASPAAAAQTLPKPGQVKGTSKKVPASLFGMHDHGLSFESQAPDLTFGGVRLWDNGVRWDQVNTAPGVYTWTTLDRAVANARAAGAKDIMYVVGYTPNWAAETVKPPCKPGTYTNCSYFPNGQGSPPKNIGDWTTWVRAVAERYKGKITQYQIWNEANLTSFFSASNSPVAMAELTVAAEKVIRQVDPRAKVITASSTVVQKKSFVKKSWLTNYLTELKKRQSKPDGIGVHLYPWVNKGPGNGDLADRARGLDMAKKAIARAGYQGLPILDTEMNYGNQRNNGWPLEKYSQNLGSAYLAQTYLESLHNGVTQVDWYGWDDYGLGVWTTAKSGKVLKPGIAYRNLLANVAGKRNKGCTITKSVTICLVQKGTSRNYYVYRPAKKKITYQVPATFKVKQACDLFDKCKPIRKGKVKVGVSPVRLTNRA